MTDKTKMPAGGKANKELKPEKGENLADEFTVVVEKNVVEDKEGGSVNKFETKPDQFEEIVDSIKRFKNGRIQKIKEKRLTPSEKNNVIHLYLLWSEQNKELIDQLPEDKKNKVEEARIQVNDEIKIAWEEYKKEEAGGKGGVEEKVDATGKDDAAGIKAGEKELAPAKEIGEEKTEQPEGQNNLEQLRLEVEQARKDYAEMDYKKRKMWSRVKNYFGNILGKGWQERRRDNIEINEQGAIRDDDVLYLEAIYKNKLFSYKNALLNDIFAEELSGGEKKKKLAETVNYFGKEELQKLSEARDGVKAEYLKKDPTIGHLISSGFSNIEKGYYKLPKAARYAIGIGTMASGSVFLIGGKRVLSGILLGYSTYRGGAGLDNFVTNRMDNKFKKKTLRDFENQEDKYGFINNKLNDKLFGVDERLHGRDWRKLGYAVAGAVLGTLIGTGKTAEFTHWLAQEANIAAIPEKFHSLVKNIREMLNGTPVEDYSMSEAPVAQDIPVAPEAPEISPVELTIENGDSLEGILINYIKEHQSEIYDHHPELKNFDSGQIAHRMYLDYLHENVNPLNKSLDLVYPGAELEIDPATLKISSFSDTKGTIGRAIEQVAGNHEKWAEMKNLSLKGLADEAKNKITGLSSEYSKFWGPEAEIKSGEKIKDWIARVARLAMKKK